MNLFLKSLRKEGLVSRAAALMLVLMLTLGTMGTSFTASAAVTYTELTGSLNIYTATTTISGSVGRTAINNHTYVAAAFGTAGWASSNAYNFVNGVQVDYRGAFDGNAGVTAVTGSTARGAQFFDGQTQGHCGIEFKTPQLVSRIGYMARQSADRLDGAIFEGSNDGTNYTPLYTISGSSSSTLVYKTAAEGLIANTAYKYFRIRGTDSLNGALNVYELKLYTYGNGEALLETISLPAEVFGEVTLPTIVSGYPIKWVSNTPNVATDDGQVIAPDDQRPITATFTASVEWGGTTYSKQFSVSVIKFEPSVDSDIVKGMDLIADFNFDNPTTGLTGGGAKANVHGTPSYVISRNNTSAAKLGSSFWLDVTKEDGTPLLAGVSEFTVSYDSSPATTGNNGWVFFATRTYRTPKSQWESYLGINDTSTNINVERFHNSGTRPEFSLYATPAAGWRHVDVVFTKTTTKIYINGVLKNIQSSDYPLEQVLSANGGILYLGRSTWGSENFTGVIDNFKIWKPVDPSDTGKVAAAKNALTLPYGVTENQVYGNITLPKEGLYGTSISWATDSPSIIDVNEHANPGYDTKLAGTVTRPAADTVVTMTATIKSGSVTDTKTFRFTVKKAPKPVPDTEAYIFAHFTGTEGSATDEQIYFATSKDGTNWEDLRASGKPILSSTSGDKGVRDPYILRSPEGDKFYLIATDLNIFRRGGWGSASWQNSSTKIVVWESTDLINWGKERLIDVAGGIPDAGNLWAPEAIYDEVTGDYFVFWATYSTVSNYKGDAQNMYYSRTRDFYTFTEPKLWIDESNDVIDTTIMKVGDTYYRASRTSAISIDSHDTLTGDWTRLGTLQNIFGSAWTYGAVEGPEFFLYNKKDWTNDVPTWGLMVDQYGTGRGYKPFRTTNIADLSQASWSVGNDINFGSLKKRHGSIMNITMDEYNAFMEAYKSTTTVPDTYPAQFELPSGMDLLVNTDFNTLTSGATEIAAGDYAKVNVKGTASTSTDTRDGSAFSANVSSNFWMDIVKKDGTPLLTGREEIVVSYDSKATNTGSGWSFYADRDTTANSYQNEHYLGVMDKSTGVTVERYNNSGSRPSNSLSGSSSTNWKHVDIVVRKGSTALYINGQLASNSTSTYKLSDILTTTGGVVQFGKANWGSGEYYSGLVDNIKIYAAPVVPSQLFSGVTAKKPTYVTIRSDINQANKEAKLYISRNNSEVKNLNSVPLEFSLFVGTEIVDLKDAYDLTSPVKVKVSYNGGQITEDWTISAELCNNPVLPGRYADPDVLLSSNGRYYIYPTTDGYSGWSGYQFKVFSSEDMIDWVDEGIIVDLQASESYLNSKGVAVATVPWSNGNAWAPAIEEKDGKYYYYFCGNYTAANNKAIGVAVADSPTGPFTVKETPLLTLSDCTRAGVSMGQVIDPQIYTENGISYMLFGNGNAAIVQLGEDMMSWVPGTMKNLSGATSFREAIAVNKIDGIYHFTWSCDDTGSENYQVRYGISDNLYGPILYKGILLQKDNSNDIKGTGHHAILYHPVRNEYYIVYHRFWTPLGQPLNGGLGNNRETCIDKLEYKDGMFKAVTPTLAGITEPVYAADDGTIFSQKELKANAKLQANTCFVNDTDKAISGRVLVAIYDNADVLVDLQQSDMFNAASNSRTYIQTSINLPADVTGLKVKAFVWDDKMAPLRDVTSFK